MFAYRPKRRMNLILAVGLVAAIVLLVVACGGGEEETVDPTATSPTTQATPTSSSAAPTETAASMEGPIPGGTVTMPVYADPFGFDASRVADFGTMNSNSMTHSRLFRYFNGPNFADPNSVEYVLNYEFQGDLARDYEFETPTRLRIDLREGVKWQNLPPLNGRQFACSDVQFSINRYLDPESPVSYLLGPIDSVECRDALTVVINLSEPYVALPQILAANQYPMYAPEVLEEFGTLETAEAVIGTGPFILKSHNPGVEVVFERNPDYYRAPLPYLDEVVWKVVPDINTAFASFQAGDLDFVSVNYSNYFTIAGGDRSALSQVPGVVYNSHPFPQCTDPILMRTDRPPLDDVRVRQAIRSVLNSRTIVDTVYGGHAEVGRGEISPGFIKWWLPDSELDPDVLKFYEFDQELAKELMVQAGYQDGFDITLVATADYGPTLVQEAEFIASSLSLIDIQVEIVSLEYGAYVSSVPVGDFEGMALYSQLLWNDPEGATAIWYLPGSPFNSSHVDDPVLTDMLLAQRAELDPVQRKALWDDIYRYLSDKFYYICSSSPSADSGWHGWVNNVGFKEEFEIGAWLLEAWLAEDAPGRK